MVTLREERSRVLSLTSPVVPEATLVQSWATRPDAAASGGAMGTPGKLGGAITHASATAGAIGGGRPSLMTPAKVESVTLDATGESLPLQAIFSDERRIAWKKFELPATFTQSDGGPARDDVGLKLHTAKGSATVRVALDGGLPRQQRQGGDAPAPARAPDADAWHQASDVAEALCDQHFDLVSDLYDHASSDEDVFFDGPAGGVAAWPLERVVAAWRQAALRDEPRPAFIVKLAETLPQLLAEVCHAPRKQLTRQRTYQPAGRVHEVDATCLRWLARQPGATVAEKAGAKQMALAVERVEHADTLENRIVRELLRQAQAACQRYLAENMGDQDHVRVAIVEEFKRVLDRLWSQSPVSKLTPLSGIPHPNYVLQQDPRYRPLWKAYVMLLKQNLQRHQAWRWRHRMFSEAVSLAVLSALSTVAPQGAAMKSSVLVRGEFDMGRFIDPRTALGRWEIRLEPASPEALATTRRVHFVEQHQFNEYRSVCTSFPEQLCTLSPDFAVVCYDGDRPDKPAKRMIAVWTMLDFDLDHDALESRCKAIDEGIRRIRTTTEIYGLLVQPKLRLASSRGVFDQVCVNRCAAYRMALPLQGQMSVFEKVIRAIVETV